MDRPSSRVAIGFTRTSTRTVLRTSPSCETSSPRCSALRTRSVAKREKLYRIEGSVEADVVYDSDDLIVRHIKNKNASMHYGHATKWCISMTQEGYFEDYETHNATFFFFERKKPQGDEFDKACLMIPRGHGRPTSFS